MDFKLETHSFTETMNLGNIIAKYVFPSFVITLDGDLGAGKTTFVKGLASSMGVKEKVTSPTFNILKCYFIKPLPLYHIDAYRLDSGNKDIGLEEFIEGDGVCVIEWPNFIEEMISDNVLNINIKTIDDDKRIITLSSSLKCLESLFNELKEVYHD